MDRQEAPDADYRVVSPGYFATLGIPLRRGRDFTPRDLPKGEPVALISETMARRYWPDEDPLGKQIRLGGIPTGPMFTIIGVTGDVRYQSLESPEIRPMVYFSLAQRPQRGLNLIARSSDPASLTTGLRRIVGSLDPALAVPPVSDLAELVREATGTQRFALTLFGVFAGVATLLAGIGIYGVMAFLVRQRTHELGIRVALGAPRGRLMALIVGRALRMTLGGVALGLLGAWYLSKSMGALLFATSATDRLTFAVVALLVVVIGVAASVIPARRAMRADPMEALRGDA
jgi:predicted permease